VSDRVSVSIGIPFLNARPYLADAVRSVFAQTHEDWELLLVDDGSSDGSVDVVRHLDDPRVRVLSDGHHRGLCARLNQITSLAEGAYLARMDADDLMHPERVERQIGFLRANPSVDVIDTATFTVDDHLTPLGIRGDDPLDPRAEAVLEEGLLVHPTVMGRVEWFRGNPYDPAYVRAEDRELWSRTCATTTFARLCEPLFFYREGPTGNLDNYLNTEKTVRAVLHRYGPPLVGRWRTRRLVMRSRLKSMAYRLATALGRQDRLIKRRNRPLTVAEAQEARRILSAIRNTAVPGLEGLAQPVPARRPFRHEAAAVNPSVLHVTTIPVTLGFLTGHVAHAKSRGFEVHALSSPGEPLVQFGQRLQIDVHAVVMPRRITPLVDLAALWRIVRIIRQVRPTIVDGHTPKGALLAMMAATVCRVPVRIYHQHGLRLMTATGSTRRVLCWAERMTCRLAHHIICISHSLREVLIEEGFCLPEKIQVLEHGSIDGVEAHSTFDPARISMQSAQRVRARYQIPENALVMGFVGRIVRDKGVIELTESWRTLRAEYPSVHLLIAGPLESHDPIPADVEATLRSDPRVHLAGMVHDMPSIYRILDLLVLPTYREGFGLSLLEAAAMELPVVATRIPGCVDAVRDGETGLLVPVRDAEALTVAIRTYLDNPKLRRQHGTNGRHRALRDFDPEVMREALFHEYLRLLVERGCAEVVNHVSPVARAAAP
jgi:glycosyltransferase involved in cell wall biosynthesis